MPSLQPRPSNAADGPRYAAHSVSAADFAQPSHVVLAVCTPHRRQWPRGQAHLIRYCQPDPFPTVVHRQNPPRFFLASFPARFLPFGIVRINLIFSLYAWPLRLKSRPVRNFSLDHAHKLDKSTRIVVTACGRARRFPTRARILRSSSSGPGRFPSATSRSGRATAARNRFARVGKRIRGDRGDPRLPLECDDIRFVRRIWSGALIQHMVAVFDSDRASKFLRE